MRWNERCYMCESYWRLFLQSHSACFLQLLLLYISTFSTAFPSFTFFFCCDGNYLLKYVYNNSNSNLYPLMGAWDAFYVLGKASMENGEVVLFDLMYLCSIWVGALIKLVKVECDIWLFCVCLGHWRRFFSGGIFINYYSKFGFTF